MSDDTFKDYLRSQLTMTFGLPRITRLMPEVIEYDEAMFSCLHCQRTSSYVIAWPVARTIVCAHCQYPVMQEILTANSPAR